MKYIKKYLPLFVFVLASSFILWQNVSHSNWRENRVFYSDPAIYYSYLPATFIDDNTLFDSIEGRNYKYSVHKSPIGRNAVKMSMGVAILEAPFFMVGHVYAQLDPEYEADGYAIPYHLAISVSSAIYTILGLLFLWFFLKRKFSVRTTIVTLLLIAFATNIYHYSVYLTGMAHTPTFFLLSALLLLTDDWVGNRKIWRSLLIGAVLGLIVLIRPINLLFCIPFLFFLKDSGQNWSAHLKKIFLPVSHIVWIMLGGFLILLPQLLFWKIQTGSFLYYSYRHEGFFWLNLHIWDGLFSIRKGWFIYTPLMFLTMFGLIQVYKTRKEYFWGTVVFLIPFLYVTFSWWCWWYGGSFGARTLIDILPFMAIPLAGLIEWIFKKRLRTLLMVIPLFFIYLNQYQSWQYSKGIIHFDAMTWEGYKTVFLRHYTPEGYWEQLKRPDYENAVRYGEEKTVSPVD
jgi:hypothetical protein